MSALAGSRAARVTAGLTAALVVFGLGVGAGAQLSGGGSRPRVPAAVGAGSSRPAPQTAKTAVSAAAGYATVMATLFPLDPDAARAVLAGDASDAYRTSVVHAVDAVLLPLQQQMSALAGHPVYRQSALATKLVSFAGNRAEVSVWVVAVAGQLGVADNAVCSFATVTVDVVFERGGWRLDQSYEQPGPSPQMTGAPSPADELVSRLGGFDDWRP